MKVLRQYGKRRTRINVFRRRKSLKHLLYLRTVTHGKTTFTEAMMRIILRTFLNATFWNVTGTARMRFSQDQSALNDTQIIFDM